MITFLTLTEKIMFSLAVFYNVIKEIKRKKFLTNYINVILHYLFFELILLLGAFCYYLFFANRGIELFDEGYFVHAAERIFQGEQPYRDFAFQYTPAYFYLLAFLYKIFGPSVLAGRFLSLSICMLIICFNFLILNKLKLTSYKIIFLSFLGIVSFGYPLINIPTPVWPIVLISLALILANIYWLKLNSSKHYFYLVIIGLLLGLSLSLRQNLGLAFILLWNFLIFFEKSKPLLQRIKNLLVINTTWFVFTFFWVYYFFSGDNIVSLIEFINFSKKFSTQFAFTYPPISFILKPLGIFKLLPYYLPLIFLLFVVRYLFGKNKNWNIISFSLVSLTGFIMYVYPNSELLHVYPFLGPILASAIIFFLANEVKLIDRGKLIITFIIVLMIGIGFYLTLFREYYRYNPPYRLQNTSLNIPRARGIMVEKTMANNLTSLSKFMNQRTLKNNYIFSYPYYPMIYFILNRRNPSKDLIYALRLWHQYDDKIILDEIKNKKVKYIVTSFGYVFDSDISRFIAKQKEIFKNSYFKIFEIVNSK